MTEKAIAKTIRATRRNWNIGIPLDFEGRCVQLYPMDDGRFEVSAGCYTELKGIPEYDHLAETGAAVEEIDMGESFGKTLVKFKAVLTKVQLEQYLAHANGADLQP